jgi:hypothetical protein
MSDTGPSPSTPLNLTKPRKEDNNNQVNTNQVEKQSGGKTSIM